MLAAKYHVPVERIASHRDYSSQTVCPGKNLYLLSTGTGLAPFLSIIKDPETYHRFEKVVLVHGVRQVDELAYREVITEELPTNEYFGENVRDKLIYYPTVTREQFRNMGAAVYQSLQYG